MTLTYENDTIILKFSLGAVIRLYKVIIADDERIVLNGLKNTFDWEQHGFEVCGLAENGKEALDLIEAKKCHVVVTDIRMPDMDGLELTRKIKEKYPYIHVIIVSAYSDFEYAQEAIKHGVSGYLLKPLKDTELTELILKVKAELKLVELLELTRPNNKVDLNKAVLNSISKETILKKLLDGELNKNFDIKSYLNSPDWISLDGSYSIALCGVEFDRNSAANIWGRLSVNVSLSCLQKMNIPAIEHSGFSVMFLNNSNKYNSTWRNKITGIFEGYRNSYKKELKEICTEPYQITIGVSNLHNNISSLKKAFDEAVCAYRHKYFVGAGRTIFYEDLELREYSELTSKEFAEAVNKIINTIFVGKEGQLLEEINSFFSLIEIKGNFSKEDLNTKIIEVFFSISQAVRIDDNVDIFSDEGDIINDIQKLSSYNNLKKWFEDRIVSLFKKVRLYNYDDSNWMIQKAIHYVKANASKKITLEDIADYLHVNASYFSTTFKKNTGKNFIDYVTELKVEEAKYLLQSSTMKIKEISCKVGYTDYSYFCKIFKKTEGVTPLEFRMKGITK